MRRVALWGAIFLALILSGSARADWPGWIADPKSGCKVWDPLFHPSASISWTGPCRNGLADGHGILQWYDDKGAPTSRYEGDTHEGHINGHGVVTFAGGGRYEGDFVESLFNGHGVETWPNGSSYDGGFRDGQRSGQGVYTDASGFRYEGGWLDGKRNGHGVYTWANGDRYDGQYLAGTPNGFGTLTSAGGGISYEGDWNDGCFKQGNLRAWIDQTKDGCGF